MISKKSLLIFMMLILFSNAHAITSTDCKSGIEKFLSSDKSLAKDEDEIIEVTSFKETTKEDDNFDTIEKNSVIIGNTKFTSEQIITADKVSKAGYNQAIINMSSADLDNEISNYPDIYVYYGDMGGWYKINQDNSTTYIDNEEDIDKLSNQDIYAVNNVKKGILIETAARENLCVSPSIYTVKDNNNVKYYITSNVTKTSLKFPKKEIDLTYNIENSNFDKKTKELVVSHNCTLKPGNSNGTGGGIYSCNDSDLGGYAPVTSCPYGCRYIDVTYRIVTEDGSIPGGIKILSNTTKKYEKASVLKYGYGLSKVESIPDAVLDYDYVPDVKFNGDLYINKWKNTSPLEVVITPTENSDLVSYYEYTFDPVNFKDENRSILTTSEGSNSFIVSENDENQRARLRVYARAVDKDGNKGNWSNEPAYINIDTVKPNKVSLYSNGSNVIFKDLDNSDRQILIVSARDGASLRKSGINRIAYTIDDGNINYSSELVVVGKGYCSYSPQSVSSCGVVETGMGYVTQECAMADKFQTGINCPTEDSFVKHYIIRLPEKETNPRDYNIKIYAVDKAGNIGDSLEQTINY